MALTLGDNFSYLGAKPLDGRVKYDTIAQMAAMSASTLYDGIIAFCVADGKNYQWKSTNDVDATLGKWRELATGGGGQTYNDFTGATASTAGAHGLVPAPSAGDEGKVLFGNGAWGALPSVDLSVLSNEAFQFSPNEKPVGTWTDSNNSTKLLYAKTVDCGIQSAGSTIIEVPHNVSNIGTIKFVCNGFIIDETNNDSNLLPVVNISVSDMIGRIGINNSNITLKQAGGWSNWRAYINILYTKTTDSPLPSDVKFAGVTSAGEVIYERKITISNDISMSANSWTTIYSASWLANARMVDFTFRRDGNTIFPCEMELKHSANQLNVCVPYNRTFYTDGYVILRYTLAS